MSDSAAWLDGRRPWTDEELGFIQSPPRGWKNADIAEYLGRSTATVKQYRIKLRNGWAPQSHLWTDEFLEGIASSASQSRADAAANLGCSLHTVKRARAHLVRLGVLTDLQGRSRRPSSVADRTLLAKTCVDCGLLWGGAHFPRTKGHGYGPSCYRCKNAEYRKPGSRTAKQQAAYAAAMEAATEALATPAKPYRSSHRQSWTETDVAMLGRADLTTPEIAARLGRSWKAVVSAVHTFGVTRPRERATQLPSGEWRIEFADTFVREAA
jgi:hypothetical protein